MPWPGATVPLAAGEPQTGVGRAAQAQEQEAARPGRHVQLPPLVDHRVGVRGERAPQQNSSRGRDSAGVPGQAPVRGSSRPGSMGAATIASSETGEPTKNQSWSCRRCRSHHDHQARDCGPGRRTSTPRARPASKNSAARRSRPGSTSPSPSVARRTRCRRCRHRRGRARLRQLGFRNRSASSTRALALVVRAWGRAAATRARGAPRLASDSSSACRCSFGRATSNSCPPPESRRRCPVEHPAATLSRK